MENRLSEILREIPNEVFFNDKGEPNFNTIFVEVVRIVYNEGGDNFSIPVHDFVTGKLPNLSSFQRAVPKERERRQKLVPSPPSK